VSKAEFHALELQWREVADSYKVIEASRRYLEGFRSRRSNGLQIKSVLNPENARMEEPDLPAGASLGDLLEVLVRATVEDTNAKARAAFYLANADRQTLHHLTGMPVDYARYVDGFAIGPESLACGLCVATNQPIITRDVVEEPRWQPWLWLPKQFDYRGCWSFPIQAPSGKILGSFAMYYTEPTSATARELDLAAAMTRTAAAIISRQWNS
jgi:two-component system CheB/CheR fusion protein